MAKDLIDIGSAPNDNTGDPIRTAFNKANLMFTELYDTDAGDIVSVNGQTGTVVLDTDDISEGTTNEYYTEARVSANTDVAANTAKTGITSAQASEITANTAKVSDQTVTLTEGTNVTITGTYPNFTIASDDVVGAVNSVNGDTGVVVLDTSDISENTNLYYTEARVSANTEVVANTAKVGITSGQAADIVTNNAKVSDQTVSLTEGANVTITGTYPNFTIASDDVVGAVNSVNGEAGVVVLDTDDIDEGSTNLYHTEARVTANAAVALNTAKVGITTQQASDITTNNAKVSDQTVTLTNAGNVTIGGTYPNFTIASADAVGAITSVNGAVGVVVLDTGDVAEDTNLYYTEARVAANSAVAANTAKTGITTQQASDITDNNAKVSNITTNLSITGTTDARTIVSSDGTDAIIPVATASVSGVMSKTIFDEHVVNNAKVSGTATNLTKTVSGTGFAINSSDGDNVDLSLADTDNWGLMSDEMFDAQVLNTAKVTNATHSGDVVGDTTLTIQTDAVTTTKIINDAVTVDKMADNSVDSDQYVDGSIDTIHIADDQITYAKLAAEFTTTDAITTELAFNDHQVFTKTMTAATTFTFTGADIGMVKDFILTGDFVPTFPAGTKTVAGTYDGTVSNLIQIVAVANGDYWLSISQAQ